MSATNRKTDYLLGVDFGQKQDFTALVVLERESKDAGGTHIVNDRSRSYHKGNAHFYGLPNPVAVPTTENHYAARHLERLPIGTPYPQQVAHIKGLCKRLEAQGGAPLLVADQTGVGVAVIDLMRAANLTPAAVNITGGIKVTKDGLEFGVPKRDLVGTVQVFLQSERLKVDARLPEAALLTAELEAFKYSINARGHDLYGNDVGEWRENPHDDLVLAVALACWYGEHHEPVLRRVQSFSFQTM